MSQFVSSKVITTITPQDRRRVGFVGSFVGLIRNLIESRELISVLFHRDFFGVYRKSFLGLAWLFITPMISVASWVFMFYAGVLNPGSMDIPYPAYVLLSTSIWTLFVGFYISAADTLTSGAGFIMQVKYNHEVLLVKQLAQHLAVSLINFSVMFVVLAILGVYPHWNVLLILPMAIPFALLGAGLGLVVSVLSVVVQEVRKVVDIGMNFLIWLTPVIYSTSFQSDVLQKVMKWNPLTYLVNGMRDMVIRGELRDLEGYAVSTAISLLVFVVAWRLFYLSEEYVIEKMV